MLFVLSKSFLVVDSYKEVNKHKISQNFKSISINDLDVVNIFYK